jgi:hypothetical protein
MNGSCKNNPSYMLVNCGKSCFDKRNGTLDARYARMKAIKIAKAKAELATRADRHKNCVHWATHGSCKRNPGYMLPNCAKSCRNAEHLMSIRAKRIAKEAEERAKVAKAIADKRARDLIALRKRQAYEKANPVDKNKWCSTWARNGECKKNPGYMLNFCAKSCKNIAGIKRKEAIKIEKDRALAAKKRAENLKKIAEEKVK